MPTRPTTYRRALVLALVGVVGLATPALASDRLDEIRDRIERVERDQGRTSQDRDASQQRVGELDSELEHTTAALDAADQRLRETTARVEQARIVLQEAELDLADAEAEAERIQTELGRARADESAIEQALAVNAEEQETSRDTVGAIARESYKQGGMGSLATTLELLSGEADAVDQMAMARTVLRVQDQQIRSLASQQAEQVAEQDRLGGVRQDIAYLLARAEAVVVAKDEARQAADAATVELEALGAEQERAQADLETEQARVVADLAAEQQVSDDLGAQLAELARTRHGLEQEEQAEVERIEEERRRAEEEARRRAAEEAARRAAAEEAARQAAAEEAARQRAAEREAKRQRAAAAEAQRRADEAAAAEAQRRAAAAQAEADAAEQAAQEASARQVREREEAEQAASRQAERDRVAAAQVVSTGVLSVPVAAGTSSEFGHRVHPVYGIPLLHAGLDYAAACGAPVVAAADGVVFTTGFNDRSGNFLVVDHGVLGGVNLTTAYLHLEAAPTVGPGQSVGRGQVIGHVGSTGASTGCHLHFETRENGTPVNPRGWL